ncbi:zinc ribbon domain-containing protein [Micromonospora sp. NPDC049900]|uniref:zinc ribbon domain-containing protein n=1 Tax=Micromonospora sp. NPDC049900 TaxID=3364275 RepID=UPI0037A03710
MLSQQLHDHRRAASALCHPPISPITPHIPRPEALSDDYAKPLQANARPTPADNESGRYLLSGLIRCQECGRILDAHWVNKHAAYRCRHGRRTATADGMARPRNVYIHEAKAIKQLAQRLGIPAGDPNAVVAALLEHDVHVTCAIGGTLIIAAIPTRVAIHRSPAIPHQRQPAEIPTEPPSAVVKTIRGVNVSENPAYLLETGMHALNGRRSRPPTQLSDSVAV